MPKLFHLRGAKETEVRPSSRSLDELLKAAARDEVSLRDFYSATIRDIDGFFRQRVFDDEIAKDLTAETYAALLYSLRRFDPERGTAMQYLFGIANNQYLMWRRRGEVSRKYQHRARIGLAQSDVSVEDDVVERLDRRWVNDRLTAALAELKPHERDAVQLRIIDQLPYDEVARRLDCNEGAARVRVSRALARLHDSFSQAGAGE